MHSAHPSWNRHRGVASVLAMMFIVLFGSLAATMAVVAQGNMRTAHAALRVSRSLSAAESGMVFAARRLQRETARFVVDRGVVDDGYGERLWFGTMTAADGAVTLLDPDGYSVPDPSGPGLMHVIHDAHLHADSYPVVLDEGSVVSLELDEVAGSITVPPIRIGTDEDDPYVLLQYELLDDGRFVRVTSVGVDHGIRRSIQMDFRIQKQIEYAVLAPNRIMIGKNVLVEGPIGSLYGIQPGELDPVNGDPLVLRSDFFDLDPLVLDVQLNILHQQLSLFDVDGDNRLRPDHPVEAEGINGYAQLQDHDGNEYIDDFDLFLGVYDVNSDGLVVYDAVQADAAGLPGLIDEFTVDMQLASLIDKGVPDRDGDGTVVAGGMDQSLGYLDGVLDARDLYGKVHGRLVFSVEQGAWEAAHGAGWQTIVQGPVRAPGTDSPVRFLVEAPELVEVTTDMFLNATNWFEAESMTGVAFGDDSSGQVGSNLDAGGGAEYHEASTQLHESMPLGSNGAYDWYQRPVYREMTFTNVRIPSGTNALFEECTFIGVTWVEIEEDCVDPDWNYAGAIEPDGLGGYTERFPGMTADAGATTYADTRIVSNNIRFHDCTFLGSVAGDRPGEFTHWRNKLQFTGNSRFYVDPADPDLAGQPDAASIQATLLGIDEADRQELAKSSVLMPGWSVDVGNFDNDSSTRVKLTGTIVAGVMDIRGTALVDGTLLMTFRPSEGEGPLFYAGTPDAFNTTIGYFGPVDGDGEGSDPSDPSFPGFGEIILRYDPDALLPDGIPWPVSASAEPGSYWEGR
ncbi:MAG: hypothetical protein VX908_05855 [Planctomycetota bacterium]|nr:hypothetical protein [Planctomycetota bacterium]